MSVDGKLVCDLTTKLERGAGNAVGNDLYDKGFFKDNEKLNELLTAIKAQNAKDVVTDKNVPTLVISLGDAVGEPGMSLLDVHRYGPHVGEDTQRLITDVFNEKDGEGKYDPRTRSMSTNADSNREPRLNLDPDRCSF